MIAYYAMYVYASRAQRVKTAVSLFQTPALSIPVRAAAVPAGGEKSVSAVLHADPTLALWTPTMKELGVGSASYVASFPVSISPAFFSRTVENVKPGSGDWERG